MHNSRLLGCCVHCVCFYTAFLLEDLLKCILKTLYISNLFLKKIYEKNEKVIYCFDSFFNFLSKEISQNEWLMYTLRAHINQTILLIFSY